MTRFELPAETQVGRVHLQVADLEQALAFYHDLLRFRQAGGDGNGVELLIEKQETSSYGGSRP